MKPLFSFLLFSLFSFQLFAQGMISSISVVPANPTVADNVEIHVDVQFTSSDCQPDNQGHFVNGTTISASALHCVGMLTAICNTTDVFEIGQLPAGTYTFDFTLSSGFGGSGCSPGFVPDDSDQLQFTVSGTVGIDEISFDESIAYPNPSTGMIFLKTPSSELGYLNTLSGKTILELSCGTKQIDLSELSSGVYILTVGNARTRILKN
ncbi:MAG: T9SS type A sorting domain-containing protein [Flavobacteriales bacterium]|nr:T9SS type A sorting domain-containing protein [Flavobacteriales bacterium]